jgi:hypothetical protein
VSRGRQRGGRKGGSTSGGQSAAGGSGAPAQGGTTSGGATSGATGSAPAPAWPNQIQLLVTNNRLRPQQSSPPAIAALWNKAVASARDADLPALSTDSALRLAYDAGHLAALALLAIHGLRTGTGQGHHEMAFYGAAAFGDPGLQDLVPDSEEVRGLRKSSMYDPVMAGAKERQIALEWMRRTLPAVRRALLTADPQLNLAPYP